MITTITGAPASAKTVAIRTTDENGKEKRGILYVETNKIDWNPQPYEYVRCSHGPVELSADDLKGYKTTSPKSAESAPKVESKKKTSKKSKK